MNLIDTLLKVTQKQKTENTDKIPAMASAIKEMRDLNELTEEEYKLCVLYLKIYLEVELMQFEKSKEDAVEDLLHLVKKTVGIADTEKVKIIK